MQNKDSRSEAAQESVVGNTASKRKVSGPEKHKKLMLQLQPKDEELRALMLEHNLSTNVNLMCKCDSQA